MCYLKHTKKQARQIHSEDTEYVVSSSTKDITPFHTLHLKKSAHINVTLFAILLINATAI